MIGTYRRARRRNRFERRVNGFLLGCFTAFWMARLFWRGVRAG